MSISEDLMMLAIFLRTDGADMPTSNAERLADLLDGLAGQMAGQEAQGCEFCSHPQYAGTKCKNCGREQPAQQEPTNEETLQALREATQTLRDHITRYTSLPAQQQEPVALTGKQRIYLAQAWAMLDDYALDQRSKGNDSFADGAEASSHEIKMMLSAPQPAQQQEPPDGYVVVARAVLKKLGIDDAVIDTIAGRSTQQPAQQQEPVAWRTKNATPPGGYVVFQQYPQAVADLGVEIEPLYTSPPASKPEDK